MTQEDVCGIVEISLKATQETQLELEYASFLLQLPVTGTTLTTVISQCMQLSNSAAMASDTPAEYDAFLLLQIAQNNTHVPVSNVLWLRGDAEVDATTSRRLTSARSRFRASADGVTSILQSADVSLEEWTVDDLPVTGDPSQGTVLHPRVLGRANEILGGLELSQTRVQDSSQKCRSRFKDLASACGSRVSHARDHTEHGGQWLPFGRDPAFNPLSGLFSLKAQQVGEDQYYNMSAGSTDVTVQGFPAAFFPRTVRGKPSFIIIFPVRYSNKVFWTIWHTVLSFI